MTPDAPILFFDSGVGGLSVLGPTRALLPNAAAINEVNKSVSLVFICMANLF